MWKVFYLVESGKTTDKRENKNNTNIFTRGK